MDTIRICQICALVAEGYDAHELGVSEAEFSRALSQIPETTSVHVESGEPSFSWSDCDGCGETLGGDRYDASLFDHTTV